MGGLLTPIFTIDSTEATHLLGSKLTFEVYYCAAAGGGSTVYTGAFTGGGSSAFAGLIFAVWGFANNDNNGVYPCTASTATTLTLTNPNGIAEGSSTNAPANYVGARTTTHTGQTTGAGPTWAVPGAPNGGRSSALTWSTAYTGSPTAVSVSLQGSNDQINWQTIDTTTATTGESRYVSFTVPFKFLRAYVTTLTAGTSPTAIVLVTFGK
jgi:hypothetical protein